MLLCLTGTKMMYRLHIVKWLYPYTMGMGDTMGILIDPWGILNYRTITQMPWLTARTLLHWAPSGHKIPSKNTA